MNLYKFAKKMEQDGETYYRQLAAAAQEKGIKQILTMLADRERKHYEVIVELEKGASPDLVEVNILESAKNIFEEIDGNFFTPRITHPQIIAYEKARALEKKSREFYEEKAATIGDFRKRELFLAIAEEERQHEFLMDEMVDFMRRPVHWLENAEWHHLEAY